MLKVFRAAALSLVLCLSPALAKCQTRVLLVACRDFLTAQPLGSAVSGNVQSVASAFSAAGLGPDALFIEDGTLGDAAALEAALKKRLGDAAPDDLSILYLCTHGLLREDEDGPAYALLLSDGKQEATLTSPDLFRLLCSLPGEKLLILDTCHAGAALGGWDEAFPADPTLHVLASAAANEASWYYGGERVPSGALSYFASALVRALGLYSPPQADADGDGAVTLQELYRQLLLMPSSTVQLASACPERIVIPSADGPFRLPLYAFSFGSSHLDEKAPVARFSYTAAAETRVLIRLVEDTEDGWDWANALTFQEEAAAGRHTQEITFAPPLPRRTMLQVFGAQRGQTLLCAEQLLAFSNTTGGAETASPASSTLKEEP